MIKISNQEAVGLEFQVLDNRNRVIKNNMIVNGAVLVGGTTVNVKDYVFTKDYKLLSLGELRTFIERTSIYLMLQVKWM